jgi:hypothetical protein
MADTKKSKPSGVIGSYEVLIACQNQTHIFKPGDVVTAADFRKDVIANWLDLEPPVLKAVGVTNGSDN